MTAERYLRVVEFCLWVLAASAVIVVGSLALGLLLGRNFVTGKYVMFVVGFLLFGAGSLMIQPSRPTDELDAETTVEHRMGIDRSRGSSSGADDADGDGRSGLTRLRNRLRSRQTHQHRYEARLQEIGPLAGHDLPFDRRVDRSWKIFATGLVVLAVSFLLEAGLGVSV